jgi:uncharacterized membrane protein YbhN (UPF0104 family)
VSGREIGAALSAEPEDELVRLQRDEAARKKRTGWPRIVGIAVSLAVVAGVFAFALPKIADYGAVWDVVQGMSWEWIVALLVASSLDIATYAPPWVASLPGLSYLHATRLTLASTALSLVAPGGGAVGVATSFAMLRAWGFRGRPVGLAVAVISVWNQLMILGVPILAVAALVAHGDRNRTVELVAAIALGIFAVVVAAFATGLSSARLARRVGDRAARTANWLKGLFRRAPVTWNGEVFVRFRAEAIVLIRERWRFLTAATLANHLTVFLVLLASLRAVGIPRSHVTIVEAFAAWAFSRVLGSIPITPGGVGFVELGLTGVLVAFGASNAEAVAATLIYRFLTMVPTIALGLLEASDDEEAERGEEYGAACCIQPVSAEGAGCCIAEVVGDEAHERRPDDPPGRVPGEESPPVHVGDARDPGRGDAENGDEAAEEDGLAAVPGKEAFAAWEVLLRVGSRQPVTLKERAAALAGGPVAEIVAEDGGEDSDDDHPRDRERSL